MDVVYSPNTRLEISHPLLLLHLPIFLPPSRLQPITTAIITANQFYTKIYKPFIVSENPCTLLISLIPTYLPNLRHLVLHLIEPLPGLAQSLKRQLHDGPATKDFVMATAYFAPFDDIARRLPNLTYFVVAIPRLYHLSTLLSEMYTYGIKPGRCPNLRFGGFSNRHDHTRAERHTLVPGTWYSPWKSARRFETSAHSRIWTSAHAFWKRVRLEDDGDCGVGWL